MATIELLDPENLPSTDFQAGIPNYKVLESVKLISGDARFCAVLRLCSLVCRAVVRRILTCGEGVRRVGSA